MVFKLVRIDTEEPNKIQLPLGTHLIGRGKFLDCDDKRISRNHGHLIVTEDSVVIEALHQNPCFYTKKGSEEKQLVKKFSKEKLDNGDKFGLLPSSYWYEVLHCTPATDSQATDVSNTQELDTREARTNQDINDKTLSDNVNCNVNGGENMNEKEDDDSVLDFDFNETGENAGRSESPSLLDQQNEAQQDSAHQSMPSSPKPTDPTDPGETTPEVNQTEQEPLKAPEETKSPKRSHSMEADDGVKRIKTEPADDNEEKTEPEDVKKELLVKQESDAGDAGPSSGQAAQAGASNAGGGKAPPSPPPAPGAPLRERCVYGAGCYRRNPVHKAQFAHPRDLDWGAGATAPCPYGAACRKREPRHWALHDHPPGVRPPDARPPPPPPPPPVPRPKAKKRQGRQSLSDSDESGSESPDPGTLVLTTKRARKPLLKMDSQDSENEDPFASDGSDDWVPPSDYTESQDF